MCMNVSIGGYARRYDKNILTRSLYKCDEMHMLSHFCSYSCKQAFSLKRLLYHNSVVGCTGLQTVSILRKTMNSLHLAKGESNPSLQPGSLRIYSMRFCPYAHRALLAAAAKGIKYDVVNINLVNKPEFLFSKNPEGKVPTVETEEGVVLYESLIVADYIDEAYNTTTGAGDAKLGSLHPENPFKKALDRIWVQKFSKIDSLDSQLYFNVTLNKEQISAIVKELMQELQVWEQELLRRGTTFFAGTNKPGMLDLMIWPWMERLPSLELILEDEASNLKQGFASCPTLVKWHQAMVADTAVQESYFSPEIHAQYRKMRRAGGPLDYDFLHH